MIVSTISEKVDKSDADSLASVTIKDEPGLTLPRSSRAYSVTSEPPAYEKRTSSSVKIARLIAVTVVAVALILGAAIIAAAYIQSMNNSNKTSSSTSAELSAETNNNNVPTGAFRSDRITEDAPTADHLTGEEEQHINKLTSADQEHHDDSSNEDNNDDASKDHNRMDTEPNLLEEFLENEGKILRLPTGLSDLDLDIDDLTKMFMARNPLDKSKCFVERKPIEGDFIKTFPITSKNASALPILPIVTGERISIICSSSDDDEDSDMDSDMDLDSGIISARPIMMPILGMRPPSNSISGLLGPMGSPFQLNSISRFSNGPVPSMMMPPPAFRSMSRPMPPPFGLTPPWMNLNGNDLAAEQRSINTFLNNNSPPPFLRPPFPQQQVPQRSFRFPAEPSNVGHQFQQFPAPFQQRTPAVVSDNSQEKSHVPEQRLSAPPVIPQQPRPVFRPPPQVNPTVPDLPESLIRLLEDLPDLDEPPKQAIRPARIDNNANPLPIFRVALAPPALPSPQPQPASSTPAAPRAIPFQARPVNLPFMNLPMRPPMPEVDRREGPNFFERLIHSLMGDLNNNNNNNRANAKMSVVDPMPVESRSPVPPPANIRTGSRAMREPMDVPAGVVVARPILETEDHQPVVLGVAPALGEDRVARSHFIQPRSVKAN